MKKDKIIYLYDYEKERTRPPDNLIEYIAWLTSLFSNIPEQYKKNAKTEIDTDNCYESSYLKYTISYTRPETDEEEKERLQEEESRLKRVKELELKQLKELVIKYKYKLDVPL